METIKNLIEVFAEKTEKEENYTLEMLFEKCIKTIDELEKDMSDFEANDVAETIQFILLTEDKLKETKTKLFLKCCAIKNKEEFDNAFYKYRIFLQKYNSILFKYNLFIKEKIGGDINTIVDEILNIKQKFLPINNTNIDQHTQNHKFNESYYRQIEELEKRRREMLDSALKPYFNSKK